MSQHEIDPIETLRAELSRVEVSPDFAERVRRQIAAEDAREQASDAIRTIGVELSGVSVSPEFAVRVRQQIESAPARSRWFSLFDWRWAVPVAAAAVVAAFIVTRGTTPTTVGSRPANVQARGPESQPSQTTHNPPAPATATPPAVTSIVPVAPMTQQSPSATAGAAQRTATSVAASGQQADDKLEVITDQPAILRQLWASVTTVQVAEAPTQAPEMVIGPVEVTPVAVQWLVEPPSPGGVTPIIRRVSADAERSNK
jgi:hypothetical protein